MTKQWYVEQINKTKSSITILYLVIVANKKREFTSDELIEVLNQAILALIKMINSS